MCPYAEMEKSVLEIQGFNIPSWEKDFIDLAKNSIQGPVVQI